MRIILAKLARWYYNIESFVEGIVYNAEINLQALEAGQTAEHFGVHLPKLVVRQKAASAKLAC